MAITGFWGLFASEVCFRKNGRRRAAGEVHLNTSAPEARQNTLVLVGCVKRKQACPAPAKALYTSGLFQKRAAFARKFGREWFILSALHGLVRPEDMLEPYDVTLNDQAVVERRTWARQVEETLLPHLQAGDQLVLLTGAKYGEFLTPSLERQGFTVINPLARVAGLGPQQNWLKRAVETGTWSL